MPPKKRGPFWRGTSLVLLQHGSKANKRKRKTKLVEFFFRRHSKGETCGSKPKCFFLTLASARAMYDLVREEYDLPGLLVKFDIGRALNWYDSSGSGLDFFIDSTKVRHRPSTERRRQCAVVVVVVRYIVFTLPLCDHRRRTTRLVETEWLRRRQRLSGLVGVENYHE